MQVSDSRGDIESTFAKHWCDTHILDPPLYPDNSSSQHIGKRRIDDQPGCRLVLNVNVRCSTPNLPCTSIGDIRHRLFGDRLSVVCVGATRCSVARRENATHC